MRTLVDGERRGVADGGARVPEVLTAVELEGIVAGVVRPEHHAEDRESPGLCMSRCAQSLLVCDPTSTSVTSDINAGLVFTF